MFRCRSSHDPRLPFGRIAAVVVSRRCRLRGDRSRLLAACPGRPRHLRAGRRHGRRAGQRQARRLADHRHRGDRCAPAVMAFRPTGCRPAIMRCAIRAVGYELAAPAAADVAGAAAATADLALRKRRRHIAQLTSTEWLISMPGTPEQKRPLIECMSCHTLERVVRSKFTGRAVRRRAQAHGELRQQLHDGAYPGARWSSARCRTIAPAGSANISPRSI